MKPLIVRIKNLRKELEVYVEKKEPKTYDWYSNTKRFISSIKQLNNHQLNNLINNVDLESEEGFYKLKSDLLCIFDFLDDILYEQNEQLQVTLDAKSKNQLIDLICDCFYQESANSLSIIATSYGLREGTTEEAFRGKENYIRSRILFYESSQLWKLAKKLEGKYEDLDKFILSIENGDHLKLEAKFDNIQKRIIEEIDKAEFLIWIAVAWFTDREIARRLYRKQEEGLDVKIIVIDDKINNKIENDFYQYFNVIKVPLSDKYKNLMHHKFCIIDLKKVIHGSYNWSIKAKYNKETIAIVENKSTAEKFAKEFISIKSDFQKRK